MKPLQQFFIRLLFLFAGVVYAGNVFGQGLNHQWLLGSYNFFQDPKGRILFDSSSYILVNENRKMVFKGTEGNISNDNGDLLISSNGYWIANANGDTMMNGSGLNPSLFTSNWPYGFPINFMNLIVNRPGDSSKFVLFHQTMWQTLAPCLSGFYRSEIDMSLDSGLGGVTLKNDTLFSDTLSLGIGACKHANGRDWWIIVMKDRNPVAYTILLTPNGIDTVFTQNLGFIANTVGNVSPLVFSQDGKKMMFCTPINQSPNGSVLFFDFDRCSGVLSNLQSLQVSLNDYLFGLSFSASGNKAYTCSSYYIYQINTTTLMIDTVATYDGFISPPTSSCCQTDFWGMYLAANGKIYITSGSGVQHLHEMNFPDSTGLACDLQQHGVDLINYRQLRAVPNHPNYYLGCDTTSGCPCLTTGIELSGKHDFKFRASPNPSNGNFSISYLLPQNKSGKLELIDVNGKTVYKYNLPPWSTLQTISLPQLANGVYALRIISGNYSVTKKVIISH